MCYVKLTQNGIIFLFLLIRMGKLDNLFFFLLKYKLWENALYQILHFWKKKSFSRCVGHIKNRRQRSFKEPSKVLTHELWLHEHAWGIQKITLHNSSTFWDTKNRTWVKSRAFGQKNTIENFKVIFRNNQRVLWQTFADRRSFNKLLQDLCLRFLIQPSKTFFVLRPYHNIFHLWVLRIAGKITFKIENIEKKRNESKTEVFVAQIN